MLAATELVGRASGATLGALLAALLVATPARAQEEEKGWGIEEMRYFTAFLWQEGHGRQSQAGPIRGLGREDAWILEPFMSFRVRQNKDLVHELTVPVDVVSAASTDAVDVVSKASEYNEAMSLDLTSTYSASPTTDLSFRFAFHYEEPMRSFIAGPAVNFKLFEENTIFGINATIISDGFDPHGYDGVDRGFAARTSFGVNLSYLQVLSPTTLLDGSVGITEQWGQLETTWNSIVALRIADPDDPTTVYRTGEIFPKSRNRNAFFVRLAQHIPASHTTVKGSYRFYVDENGGLANTMEAQVFQYLVPWLYLRVHGRLHTQEAPDFWKPVISEPFSDKDKRSSDSDLADLTAREAGVKIVLQRDKAPAAFRATDTFDASYFRYQRDNDLHIDFFSLGYAKTFE